MTAQYFEHKQTGKRYMVISIDNDAKMMRLRGEHAEFDEPVDQAHFEKMGYVLKQGEPGDAPPPVPAASAPPPIPVVPVTNTPSPVSAAPAASAPPPPIPAAPVASAPPPLPVASAPPPPLPTGVPPLPPA